MQDICLRLKVRTQLYFKLISHLLSISSLLIVAAIGQYSLLGIKSKGDNYPFELTFRQIWKVVLHLIFRSQNGTNRFFTPGSISSRCREQPSKATCPSRKARNHDEYFVEGR